MIRVLQIIDSLDAGGAERLAVNLANELHQVADFSGLMCTRREGLLLEELHQDVPYTFLSKKRKLDIAALRKASKYIKQFKVNMVHAHSSSFFFATLLKLRHPKIKLMWHDHYGDAEHLEIRNYKILKFCSLFFDSIISVNTALKIWAERKLYSNHVYYFQNFTVAPTYSDITPVVFGDLGSRIVCLANLRVQKNHFVLLDAFKKVLDQFPKASLHLIGADHNDAYSSKVTQLVEDLDIKDNVIIYGSRIDTADLLQQMNIGVLSSDSEGLPISLLEYGMNNLPVIVTDVGACAEVVGDHGIVVPPKSKNELASAIANYLSKPTFADEKAKSFSQHVQNQFGSGAYLERLIKIYKS
jgi:glycosyltransferase involved in cell wall biosynthesis